MAKFPSSIWTTILSVRSNPDQVKDLVFRRYRQPVYEFVRHQGLPHEDAEDVTQEVFTQVCREGFLEKANRKKGRFRTLISAVTRHVVASWRRKELAAVRDRRRVVTLEDLEVAGEIVADAEFDDLWVKNLIEQGLERLKDDPHAMALKMQLDGRSYDEIALALRKRITDVTNHIHRAKKKLRQEIEKLIKEYSGEDEVEEEIASLLHFMK